MQTAVIQCAAQKSAQARPVFHECTSYTCAFVIILSRETDWIFSSEPGRRELAESAGFDRLVLVTLHRGHTYQGLDQVKEEVSAKALELAQDNLPERIITNAHV